MKAKINKSESQSVEFMTGQRDNLKKLSQADKEKYYRELQESTKKFLEKKNNKTKSKKDSVSK
ncbi:MAG: hypothetical protein SGI89_10965 [bacterium]|nr:hypothetical protein [bacterium]